MVLLIREMGGQVDIVSKGLWCLMAAHSVEARKVPVRIRAVPPEATVIFEANEAAETKEYTKSELRWLDTYKARKKPFAIPAHKRYTMGGIVKIDRKVFPKDMF